MVMNATRQMTIIIEKNENGIKWQLVCMHMYESAELFGLISYKY